jgi:hypothetical protein
MLDGIVGPAARAQVDAGAAQQPRGRQPRLRDVVRVAERRHRVRQEAGALGTRPAGRAALRERALDEAQRPVGQCRALLRGRTVAHHRLQQAVHEDLVVLDAHQRVAQQRRELTVERGLVARR